MSTPSKARRKRREWMNEQRVRHEMHVEQLQRQHAENIKSLRRELTRMIPRADIEDNTFYPQGKIDKPYIRIMARSESGPADFSDPYRLDYLRHMNIEEFGLKAEQFALVLPDGTRVVWWGWRMA